MGFSKILIHGESTEAGAATITLELLSKARELADVVEVVMAGDANAVATELGDHGASTVYTVGAPDSGLVGPRLASAIAKVTASGEGPQVLLCGTTYDGRDVAGRLSAKLDVPVITNVVDLVADGGRLIGQEPVFGGTKEVHTGFTGSGLAIFLVRPKSFPSQPSGGPPAIVSDLEVGDLGGTDSATVRERFAEESTGPRLDEANIVVSGGRGLGNDRDSGSRGQGCSRSFTGRGGRRVGSLRVSGRSNWQGSQTYRLSGMWYLWRYPAFGGHEGLGQHYCY